MFCFSLCGKEVVVVGLGSAVAVASSILLHRVFLCICGFKTFLFLTLPCLDPKEEWDLLYREAVIVAILPIRCLMEEGENPPKAVFQNYNGEYHGEFLNSVCMCRVICVGSC